MRRFEMQELKPTRAHGAGSRRCFGPRTPDRHPVVQRSRTLLGAIAFVAAACAGEDPRPSTPADTAGSVDTAASADTAAPTDTAAPPDTTAPGDSTAPAPDSAAQDSAGDVVASYRQRIPRDLLLRRGACPFECCVYREWEATGEIPVVAEERGTAPPVFTIGAGNRFRADSGNVHVTSIAVVPVADSVGDPPYWAFAPGDTLVVLDYVGEGFYNVWHDGRVVEVPTFWTHRAIEEGDGSIGKHAAEWWVHITMPDGRTGWIRADTAPQITGADACG